MARFAMSPNTGPDPLASAEAGAAVKLDRILFVTRTFPSGFDLSVNGVYQRMRLFLEAAAAVSHQLDILFFVEQDFLERLNGLEFSAELERHWGIDARVYFAGRRETRRTWFDANVRPLWNVRSNEELFKTGGGSQARAVDNCLESAADLVFAFQLESALPVLACRAARSPFALDLNDVEHVKYPRMLARPPHHWKKKLRYAYWPALFIGERQAVRRSAVTFVCSNASSISLKRLAGTSRVKVAPNAVKFPKLSPSVVTESVKLPTLLFVGIYAYPPNFEGAEVLAREIFPLVRARVPHARLIFVGSYIEKIAHLAGPGIELRGFVEDLAAVYGEAAVACCPILAGGGTRTKIIEAAAYRVPIVATTLGAEGIEFADGVAILLRDDPASFADACAKLLLNPEQGRQLADQAYQRAQIYDRRTVIEQISRDLISAASGTAS